MQQESSFRRTYSIVVEKIAYTSAILVGAGMLWFIFGLLGAGAVVLLVVIAILLTVFKVGFLWLLK